MTNYAHDWKALCTERTDAAIEHFQNWIAVDLKELDGDTESDYAKFILQGHKHIRTVLIYLKNEKAFRLLREQEKDALCREIDDLRAELERVTAERNALRNFACQLCGKYKTAHLGSCDGCRWKLKGE